ncbi:aspartate 1-decarboxylase precursor [Lentisphaera araneosa HTCC2155]|uniref:Aspartate 1-decarboxylase n=1 Tax=Lentisphaera araneosa HTCC2155 TaxID=313628 RepID=A6DL82_9BACT|nr:hypothetical protein [Lentisphaera araneosa]EDM27684.1 aspartate 1-decarboxylase precursor [Lentisphaera araneosa HTCC2155]
MNTFLNKLENKFGHLAIPDLTKKLLILKVIVFASIQLIFQGNPNTYASTLERIQVANIHIIGDLIGALCTPPVQTMQGWNIIWLFFALSIFLMAGRGLEQVWGKFRYNLYILFYALLYLAIFTGIRFFSRAVPFPEDLLYAGVFMAFATKFPDVEIMVMFVIPVKIKYLGFIAGFFVAFMAFSALNSPQLSPFAARAVALIYFIPLLHYAAFVLPYLYSDASLKKRSKQFQKQLDPNQGRATFHKCSTCGITENEDPDMIFRVGDDGDDYCDKHI